MTILFKGQESTRNVDGKDKKVIPFAGTDNDGRISQMGVGLLYPDEESGSIWGLVAPHDIVASYRGMKIAEEVPTFEHGTLAACWYAGRRKVHPSEQKYIANIEMLIGPDTRQRILQAPLPSFDNAIRLMQERNIDFDASPFLAEIEQGNLARTPTLERAIIDYSNRFLLFNGLTGDFKKAYQTLTEKPQGFFAKLRKRKINPEHLESARAYVTMIEQMLPSLIPDFERQYWLLVQNINEGIVLPQFDEPTQTEVEQSRTKIYKDKKKFDRAASDLRGTLASQLPPEKKFIAYHAALETMTRAAFDIASEFSVLGIYVSKEEPSRDVLLTSKYLAEGTVRVINTAAREHMQGAYALT